IVVIGDGGFGIGGMELETALRHRLPLVTLLWNNSSWGPGFEEMPMLRGRVDPFDRLPELRYDRMFEAIGCHGEHVTRPEEIRPALERAFDAGGVAAGLEGAPDMVAERALDGGGVETALQAAALEADEEGAAREAVDERLGGGRERLDGGRCLDAHRRLDGDHLGERGGEERIGVERLVHAREELVDALDRADHDVAVAAATELP